ncbi:MAG: ABC transporter ATP-binding protein [Gaiellales bacterium]
MNEAEPTRSPDAVDLIGVSKTFATRGDSVVAIDGVDLRAAHREFVCIVGPSGCGKSTILKIIAGLTAASTGSVNVFGSPVQGPYKDVGMVFQAPVLLKWRTILNNVLFPIAILKERRRDYIDRAKDLLHLVGLSGFEDRRPEELSGGMQQRASIARALIHDPSLLLMDEPFGALDQITREQMNMELTRIWSETRKTTILITHSIEEAVFLGDRVVVMTPRPGRVAGVVDIDLPRPRDRSVRLTPEFNALEGRVESLLAPAGSIGGLDGQRVGLAESSPARHPSEGTSGVAGVKR